MPDYQPDSMKLKTDAKTPEDYVITWPRRQSL